MIVPTESLLEFLERSVAESDPVIITQTVSVAGSGPREMGSMMAISGHAFAGTIGGGRLEHDAIAHARTMLANGSENDEIAVVLGPETGQCCGGNVLLGFKLLTVEMANDIRDRIAAEENSQRDVYIFGAGHVGHALADTMARLPMTIHLVDTREDAFQSVSGEINTHLLAMPEELVRDARAGSAFVVMTHDHGLDFLITSEALKRGDARYVGLIGSKTKKERFRREFLASGGSPEQLGQLVSPIGSSSVPDKRPSVIASLAAAEIVTALLSQEGEKLREANGEAA